MPVLSRFYGIMIRMYFQQAEHNPPHIRAAIHKIDLLRMWETQEFKPLSPLE